MFIILFFNGHMELPIIIRLCVKDFLIVVSFFSSFPFVRLVVVLQLQNYKSVV